MRLRAVVVAFLLCSACGPGTPPPPIQTASVVSREWEERTLRARLMLTDTTGEPRYDVTGSVRLDLVTVPRGAWDEGDPGTFDDLDATDADATPLGGCAGQATFGPSDFRQGEGMRIVITLDGECAGAPPDRDVFARLVVTPASGTPPPSYEGPPPVLGYDPRSPHDRATDGRAQADRAEQDALNGRVRAYLDRLRVASRLVGAIQEDPPACAGPPGGRSGALDGARYGRVAFAERAAALATAPSSDAPLPAPTGRAVAPLSYVEDPLVARLHALAADPPSPGNSAEEAERREVLDAIASDGPLLRLLTTTSSTEPRAMATSIEGTTHVREYERGSYRGTLHVVDTVAERVVCRAAIAVDPPIGSGELHADDPDMEVARMYYGAIQAAVSDATPEP